MDVQMIITAVWPQIQIIAPISSSTQCDVYRVVSRGDSEESVIKLFKVTPLPPDRDQRVNGLLAELDVLRSLGAAPHTVLPLDVTVYLDRATGIAYVLVRVPLLTPITQLSSTAEPLQAARWVKEICASVAAYHRIGRVHGDIRESKIFLDRAGEVQVSDHGLCFYLQHQHSDQDPSFGMLHLAPEVLRSGQTGPVADIYSLGLLLYKWCNEGKGPFLSSPHPSPEEARMAIDRRLNGEIPPPPSRADQWLSGIILNCLSPGPEGRYPNAEVLQNELRAYLQQADQPKVATEAPPVMAAPAVAPEPPAVMAAPAAATTVTATGPIHPGPGQTQDKDVFSSGEKTVTMFPAAMVSSTSAPTPFNYQEDRWGEGPSPAPEQGGTAPPDGSYQGGPNEENQSAWQPSGASSTVQDAGQGGWEPAPPAADQSSWQPASPAADQVSWQPAPPAADQSSWQPASPAADQGSWQPAPPAADQGSWQPTPPAADQGSWQPTPPAADQGSWQPAPPAADQSSWQPTPPAADQGSWQPAPPAADQGSRQSVPPVSSQGGWQPPMNTTHEDPQPPMNTAHEERQPPVNTAREDRQPPFSPAAPLHNNGYDQHAAAVPPGQPIPPGTPSPRQAAPSPIAQPPMQPRKKSKAPLIIIIVIVGALILLAAAWFLLRHFGVDLGPLNFGASPSKTTASVQTTALQQTEIVESTQPNEAPVTSVPPSAAPSVNVPLVSDPDATKAPATGPVQLEGFVDVTDQQSLIDTIRTGQNARLIADINVILKKEDAADHIKVDSTTIYALFVLEKPVNIALNGHTLSFLGNDLDGSMAIFHLKDKGALSMASGNITCSLNDGSVLVDAHGDSSVNIDDVQFSLVAQVPDKMLDLMVAHDQSKVEMKSSYVSIIPTGQDIDPTNRSLIECLDKSTVTVSDTMFYDMREMDDYAFFWFGPKANITLTGITAFRKPSHTDDGLWLFMYDETYQADISDDCVVNQIPDDASSS